MAEWLRHADEAGELIGALAPGLTDDEREIAAVEGWILGVDPTARRNRGQRRPPRARPKVGEPEFRTATRRAEATDAERQAVQGIVDRIASLATHLQQHPVPVESGASELYQSSRPHEGEPGEHRHWRVAHRVRHAKEHLMSRLPMTPFDVAKKAQGAAGLDIDERTTSGARVVGEVKTTVPYGETDLGSAQRVAFQKDFKKLMTAEAEHRFLFVTHPKTYQFLRAKYSWQSRGVTVVLLPSGESFTA